MKFIRGIEKYIWVYGYYIYNIQSFIAYSYLHPEYTEEYWESLEWTSEYEKWHEKVSCDGLEDLVGGIAAGTLI